MYPPPVRYCPKMPRYLGPMEEASRLELVFDERCEESQEGGAAVVDGQMLDEEDDVFEDDGSDWEEG
jgi:hypothetical protein